VLRNGELTEERRRRYVEAISATADRAARLTGQLLAFARRQALRPQLFDVSTQIASLAEMLRTVLRSRAVLAIKADCPDCFVKADVAQFETAIVNLAVNARDAMVNGGELRIEVSKERDDSGEVVRVAVSDTGEGIDPGKLDRIFEPFFTTKEVGKGTGLGLSQVYGFVKQSDGEVLVESTPGLGTTFTLILPANRNQPQPDTAREPALERVSGGGRVLVVEDNDDVRMFTTELLQDIGFNVEVSASADEAIAVLEKDEAFDVIFSDVVMPGMSGLEFAQLARQRWPSIPIVLTSGYSHVLVQDTSHGFPLLQKPYSAEAITEALESAQKGLG